ncbi:hypothetical protein MCAP1_003159 [Malassezia caprae]|uniref:Ferric reductase NAD binding domain-containing protein n=1 Tax=Malassezia caprae TaxID=1381934 RepID=A0AAF0IWK6_9BASI|nr:hypothetical protein MCAP1_003159 [Malassezia caprae]
MSIPSDMPNLPNKLVLLARVENGITRQLYNMTAAQRKEHDLEEGKVSEPEKSSVCSPGNSSDHSYGLGIYEHAVLVAGGSGITFCIPQVTELLRRSISGDSLITKTVRLVWLVRSFDILRWIKPEIQQLDDFVHKSNISVHMDVYAHRETIPYKDENIREFMDVHHAQRVDVASVIDEEVSKATGAMSKTIMSYEFFVVQHIASTALFLGFSFVHFEDLLDSHIWLWLVMLARVENGITRQLYNKTSGHGKERIAKEVAAPKLEKASVKSPGNSSDSSMGVSVDYSPTKNIFQDKPLAFDQDTQEVTAYLDGPYSHNYGLGMYEHAVLVAAGSGITFCLPHVTELLRHSIQEKQIITKSICLIWTIRSFDMIRWIKEEMQQLDEFVHRSGVEVHMHVYASRELTPLENKHMHDFLYVYHGQRVDFSVALDEQVNKAMEAQSKTMCILACAPKDLVSRVGNKVSSLNASIAMGGLGSLNDVRFVPELFSF